MALRRGDRDCAGSNKPSWLRTGKLNLGVVRLALQLFPGRAGNIGGFMHLNID